MTSQVFTSLSVSEIDQLIEKRVQIALNELKPTEPKPAKLLTRNEVSEKLGVSLVTLHHWVKKGIIPAQRIGSRIRFYEKDIIASLNQVESLKYRRV